MKKALLINVLGFLIVILIISRFSTVNKKSVNQNSSIPTPTISSHIIKTELEVSFPNKPPIKGLFDFDSTTTVYDLLNEALSFENTPIVIQKYDFGTLVESIGDYKNTKDNAWIYYVNGKAGDVAADKYVLKDGDVIEWKYEKPLY